MSSLRIVEGETMNGLMQRTLGAGGVTTAVVISIPAAVASLPVVPSVVSLLTPAAMATYYFRIIRHVTDGKPALPPPVLDESMGEMALEVLRSLLCALVVALPVLATLVLAPHRVQAQLASPLLLAIACIGFCYAPAVILAVTMTGSAAVALWPGAWWRIIVRAPIPYARATGIFVAMAIAWWYGSLGVSRALGGIPLLGALAAQTVGNLLLFMQAILLGDFLYRNSAAIGSSE